MSKKYPKSEKFILERLIATLKAEGKDDELSYSISARRDALERQSSYFEVAKKQEISGDHEEAENYYKKCLELNPKHFEAIEGLMRLYEHGKLKNIVERERLFSDLTALHHNGIWNKPYYRRIVKMYKNGLNVTGFDFFKLKKTFVGYGDEKIKENIAHLWIVCHYDNQVYQIIYGSSDIANSFFHSINGNSKDLYYHIDGYYRKLRMNKKFIARNSLAKYRNVMKDCIYEMYTSPVAEKLEWAVVNKMVMGIIDIVNDYVNGTTGGSNDNKKSGKKGEVWKQKRGSKNKRVSMNKGLMKMLLEDGNLANGISKVCELSGNHNKARDSYIKSLHVDSEHVEAIEGLMRLYEYGKLKNKAERARLFNTFAMLHFTGEYSKPYYRRMIKIYKNRFKVIGYDFFKLTKILVGFGRMKGKIAYLWFIYYNDKLAYRISYGSYDKTNMVYHSINGKSKDRYYHLDGYYSKLNVNKKFINNKFILSRFEEKDYVHETYHGPTLGNLGWAVINEKVMKIIDIMNSRYNNEGVLE